MLTPEDAAFLNRAVFPQGKSVRWLPDSDKFIFTEENNLMVQGVKDKTAKVLYSLDDLNTIMTNNSLDSLKRIPFLNWIDNNTAYYLTSNDDNYVLNRIDFKNRKAETITSMPNTAENIKITTPSLKVAYTIGNDLYVNDGEKQIQITQNPEGVIAGQAVHRNEFAIDGGIFWSPDGNKIAYYLMDERMVTDYPLVDIITRVATDKPIKYPMAGMTSHQVTLNIYDVTTGNETLIKTGEPVDQYLTAITWNNDNKKIYIGVLNREQNHLKFNEYDAQTGDFVKTIFEDTDEQYVEPGRGYLVAFDTERDMTFNGMMQHGNVSIPITRENTGSLAGFNLLGNPYPSYLDWESVYHASTNVSPTIYVWDEDKSQYATYDANLQMGTFDKTQYLAPGQGFFVKCNNASGGNVVFDDNARCHKSSTEVPFRGENIIMKINVEGAVSGIDELIMKLNCPETAGALKMTSMSENAPYLSYEYENEDYVMICLGEELSKDSLPFKFKAGQNDDFIMTFDIQNFEGDFLELEDLLTGEKVDLLSQNHYNFAGAPNDVAQRFRINFKEALGVEGINERELFVYSNGDMVSIYGIQGRSQIRIYDVRGILLSEKTSGENNVELNISNYKSGLYIIQVSDETGVFTKKIIVGK